MSWRPDLSLEIDGISLAWNINPVIGLGRWLYQVERRVLLTSGTHKLSVKLLNVERKATAQLCHIELLEYSNSNGFNSAADHYGLYPTYDSLNLTTYRPTNNNYIMRNMQYEDFCSICTEGIWLKVFSQISFLDEITRISQPDGSTLVMLRLLPLVEFRFSPVGCKESYEILWYNGNTGQSIKESTNKTVAVIPKGVKEIAIKYALQQI